MAGNGLQAANRADTRSSKDKGPDLSLMVDLGIFQRLLLGLKFPLLVPVGQRMPGLLVEEIVGPSHAGAIGVVRLACIFCLLSISADP